MAVKGNNDMEAACKVEKGSWSEEELKTIRKGKGKQFERQAKGENGRQVEQETRSVAGKGSGKHCERQARGDNSRQGERETRSVTGKVSERLGERQASSERGRHGNWSEREREKECGRKEE